MEDITEENAFKSIGATKLWINKRPKYFNSQEEIVGYFVNGKIINNQVSVLLSIPFYF